MESRDELMRRLQRLEAEAERWRALESQGRLSARRARRWGRRGVLALLAVVGLLLSGVAYAQLVQFSPGSPALASDVNSNFAQLRTWIEQKVGTVGSANLSLTGVIQGTGGLTLKGQSSNGNDLRIASDGTVSVAGREVGLRGVTYTRWGDNACPSGRTTLYSGYMASGHYTHTGGSVTILCMHQTPENIDSVAGVQGGALLYKVEFETSHNAAPALNATGIHNNDAQCSVCEAPRDQVLMVAGRRDCPSGWTEEYDGYLMSEYYTHERPSETLCVDATPTTGLNTGNEDGGTLYPLEAGTPTIQGYTTGNTLSCAVCTK